MTSVSEVGRRRRSKNLKNRLRLGPDVLGFRNPYPYMSEPEAMVHLELERRQIPFSWRNFDGTSAHREAFIPEFHPEFTLREYNIAIVVIGGFFGTLPSVLDQAALGVSALEADNWKCATWSEAEIRNGVADLMDKDLPELVTPAIRGAPRVLPWGIPDFMAKRRQQLSGLALTRKKFKFDKQGRRNRVGGRKPRRFGTTDSGRRRRSGR